MKIISSQKRYCQEVILCDGPVISGPACDLTYFRWYTTYLVVFQVVQSGVPEKIFHYVLRALARTSNRRLRSSKEYITSPQHAAHNLQHISSISVHMLHSSPQPRKRVLLIVLLPKAAQAYTGPYGPVYAVLAAYYAA